MSLKFFVKKILIFLLCIAGIYLIAMAYLNIIFRNTISKYYPNNSHLSAKKLDLENHSITKRLNLLMKNTVCSVEYANELAGPSSAVFEGNIDGTLIELKIPLSCIETISFEFQESNGESMPPKCWMDSFVGIASITERKRRKDGREEIHYVSSDQISPEVLWDALMKGDPKIMVDFLRNRQLNAQ